MEEADAQLTIRLPLEDQSVRPGEEIVLTAEVEGQPRSVKWYKNGRQIEPDKKRIRLESQGNQRFQLIISDATVDDAASYKIEAQNNAGLADSQAKVDVKDAKAAGEAPIFVQKLHDQSVRDGKSAVFQVQLSEPPDSFAWLKDGKVLGASDRIKIEQLDDCTWQLVIAGATDADSGQYSAQASNQFGPSNSTAALKVTGDAPTFRRGLSDRSCPAGAKLVLVIEVDGKPTSVSWNVNGKPVSAGHPFIVKQVDESTFHLEISSADGSCAGEYSVQAANDYGSASSSGRLTIEESKKEEKPSFVRPLKDLSVNDGEKAVFEVEVAGKPKEVKWYKNGRELKPSTRVAIEQLDEKLYRLVIGDACSDDQANYEVRASNSAGSADSQAQLTVSGQAPSFVRGLDDQRGTVGAKLVLEAELAQVPSQLKWFKNGNELRPDGKRICLEQLDERTFRLVISDLQKGDAGSYEVRAANPYGESKSHCGLVVEEATKGQPPILLKGLQDVAVTEGEKVAMQVQIGGKPKEVKWYKNGRLLKPSSRLGLEQLDDSTWRLAIAEATRDDQGQYRVEAENDYGTVASEAQLTVKEEEPAGFLPKFVSGLQNASIGEDETITFKCTFQGAPFPEIAWLKDGEEVEEDARHALISSPDGSCSLTIKRSTAGDQGNYMCIIRNQFGEDRTQCRLGVLLKSASKQALFDKAPEFLRDLRDRVAQEGDEVGFEVRVLGSPMPELIWYRDGEELIPSDIVVGKIECIEEEVVFRLNLRDLRQSDSCAIKCVARNRAGEASTACQLTVNSGQLEEEFEPRFVIPLRDTVAAEGKTISMEIKVRGKPSPTLSWFKDGAPLQTDARVYIEDMGDSRWRLVIQDASTADDGVFKCEAKNAKGSDVCKGELTVNPSRDKRVPAEDSYAPQFTVPLHDRRIPEHQMMSVECHVTAKPKAEIKWYCDGVLVEDSGQKVQVETFPDGKCRLVINDFQAADEGSYRCVASNDLGQASTKCKLSVEVLEAKEEVVSKEVAPRFAEELSDRTVKPGGAAVLQCKVVGLPAPSVSWFKDGIAVLPSANLRVECEPDGTCRLSIPNATEADAGTYRCVATNPLGSCNTVGALTVPGEKAEKKRAGEAPQFTLGLKPYSFDQGAQAILKCAVSGDPTPNIKWLKDGLPCRLGDRMQAEQLPDGTCLLHIAHCTRADEGLYRCLAENQHGSASTLGPLTVTAVVERKEVGVKEEGEAPRFVIPLEDASGELGTTIEMACKVQGKPMPALKWFKDGAPLRTNHRVSVEQEGDGRYLLRITDVQAVDLGTYRCQASNDFGTVNSKAQLKVTGEPVLTTAKPDQGMSMPRFLVPLADARGNDNEPLTLECKVAGVPLPELEWYKDGELLQPGSGVRMELQDDGTARLLIDSFSPDWEGLYRVVARNPAGSTHCKAKVSARAARGLTPRGSRELAEPSRERAPRFLSPLEPVKAPEGASITLSCKVVGEPRPTLKWFKDGFRLYPYGRIIERYDDDGTTQLTIKGVTSQDAGLYRCVAENHLGSDRTHAPLTVDIKAAPASASLQDQLKSGKAPGFLKPLTVCRVGENGRAVLECQPFGNPFPQIKWLKDGMEVSPNDRISLESLEDGTQRLTVDNCRSSDEGFYRCLATNEHGLASTKAELIVEQAGPKLLGKRPTSAVDFGPPDELDTTPKPPRFRRGLHNITVTQGSPATFECCIAGYPKPTVKWFRGDHELLSGDGNILHWVDEWGFARLLILNARPDDEAEYRCEIENEHGSAKSEAQLSVLREREVKPFEGVDGAVPMDTSGLPWGMQGPPGFLRQLRNKHTFAGCPAIFDCIVCGSPAPEIQWLHNGKPLQSNDRIKLQACGGGSYALVILKAMPDDAGEIVCVASNPHGQAQSLASLEVAVPFDKLRPFGDAEVPAISPVDWMLSKLHYVGIPTPPDKGPFIAEVTGHYLTLSWIPTLRPPPRYPQITYIIEMRELPDRDWVLVDYNIPQPCCRVRNLELGKSYQFRVRAENLYGISDPSPASPPSQLMAPPKPVLDKNRRPIPILDPYAQDALQKAYSDQYACAPWFAPVKSKQMYSGSKQTFEVVYYVYGYPDPQITWLFDGQPIKDANAPGSRHRVLCLGGTECILQVRDFSRLDVGDYVCRAENVHGDAQESARVDLAELPTFQQHLDSKTVAAGSQARLSCRVDGNPTPDIKWYKDWHPVAESSRIRFLHDHPNYCLVISDCILRDTGVYQAVAHNAAGRMSSNCTLTVEADLPDFTKEAPMSAAQPHKKVTIKQSAQPHEVYTIKEEEEQEEEADGEADSGEQRAADRQQSPAVNGFVDINTARPQRTPSQSPEPMQVEATPASGDEFEIDIEKSQSQSEQLPIEEEQ